ncbi:HIT family protein [Alphaproteobacteria bacterium]|jgi:diadenosine tetraphosphate (Ap4A) HIT family hydrolase|nr:HIT family protein [Alphaproteobacteria bacterium]
MNSFILDQRLAADSQTIGASQHCDVRLMSDSRFLWLLLVPKYADIIEWHDLPDGVGAYIFDEVRMASRWVKAFHHSDKINIGALGNQVQQLHIHVIGRNIGDAAWPNPVWGSGSAVAYGEDQAKKIIAACRTALSLS